MDNALRLQYLEAMGIDVWIPKTASVELPHPSSFEAMSQDTWDLLKADITQCTQCELCTSREQPVLGSGNQQAYWMLITEAPGQDEAHQGEPLTGSADALLTEMLRAINLTRNDVFITNITKCAPPKNRDPHVNEIENCSLFLQRQQQLLKPKIIIALGRVSAQALLKTNEPLAKLRNQVHALNDTPIVVVYHPAYLLRFLPEKSKAWLDLTKALQTFTNNKG